MIEGAKTLDEQQNSISEFTVQFFADSVSVDGMVLPLGQISTDVLNVGGDVLVALREKNLELFTVLERELFNLNTKKDAALAETNAELERLRAQLAQLQLTSPGQAQES